MFGGKSPRAVRNRTTTIRAAAQVDRGSGRTASAEGASCSLDFFNSGLSPTEVINAVLSSLPASAAASVSSSRQLRHRDLVGRGPAAEGAAKEVQADRQGARQGLGGAP